MAVPVGPDSAARIAPLVTAAAFALSEITIRIRSSGHRDGVRADRCSIVAVIGTIAVGVLGASWCATTGVGAAGAARIPMLVAGVVAMWTGIVLRQWAVHTLGPDFTVVVRASEQQVVADRGPYRWVRHPAYLGLLVTVAGVGLAFGNWLSLLALTVLPIVGLVIRIRVEERALLDIIGEPYRAYAAAHRWRLLPGLW